MNSTFISFHLQYSWYDKNSAMVLAVLMYTFYAYFTREKNKKNNTNIG